MTDGGRRQRECQDCSSIKRSGKSAIMYQWRLSLFRLCMLYIERLIFGQTTYEYQNESGTGIKHSCAVKTVMLKIFIHHESIH